MATDLERLQKQLDKKPSMLMEVSELKDIIVTKQQVKLVLDALITKLKEGERKTNELIQQIDAVLNERVSNSENANKSAIDKLKSEITAQKQELMSDQRTFGRMIEQKLQEVTDMISYYDDSAVYQKIEEVRGLIPTDLPKEFDATELENRVDQNEKDIEELKKRPATTTGGGVTNARITQAFKYILKTETPVGDIDGVNKTYTVSQPIFAVLAFSLNGEVIAELPNYTISGKSIVFSSALPAAYSGKDFEIKYV